MKIYEEMKKQWQNAHKREKPFAWKNYDELAPGKFCVLSFEFGYSDAGGREINQALFIFDTAKDAVSYFRFAEIPKILSWHTGRYDEKIYQDAEVYLPNLGDQDLQTSIRTLLQLLDDAINAEEVSADLLNNIRDIYNSTFEQTNPENQIPAWGSLTSVLKSSHFNDFYLIAIEEDEDENAAKLIDILTSDKFDENNEEHMALAKGLFADNFNSL